jgi:alpha-beta hydrolase superfamily lysophospholipase
MDRPAGFDPRAEPPAPDVRRAAGHVRTADGFELRVRSWIPSTPRAAVSIVHGLAEHAQRYGALAVWLAERGFAVHAVDCRGHGESPGPRVHVDSFDEFVADAASLRAHTGAAHPALPHFLLGHSQGALVSILSVARDPAGLAGVVLSSPFLALHAGLRPNRVMRLGVGLLLRVMPARPLPIGAPPQLVSRDEGVVAFYRADPLVTSSNRVSAGWYRAQAEAQAEAIAAASGWAVPTLLMAAGSDLLTDVSVTEEWARQAPSSLVRYVPWPGMYHEIFNEPERLEVYATLVSWLESRLSS